MARGIDTKCIHLEEDEGQCNHYGALSSPIYQTATYAHPGVGQSTGFDYSRLQNLKTTGAGLAPFDCWLVLRGMKTLGIRMERSQENAKQIAAWPQQQKAVTKVIYPGLPRVLCSS